MTIDVERLRQLHRSYQPVPPYGELYCQGCYLEWPCATSKLLDAYEERDRLREILERLRTRMAEPQQPIIQWDAGTWIERIDAALEGWE